MRVEMPSTNVEMSYTRPAGTPSDMIVKVTDGESAWCGTEVLYERTRAATPMPVVLKRGTGQVLIKDKDPLDLDRDITGVRGGSGRRYLGKASSLLSGRPLLVVGWQVSASRHLHRGQPFVVDIRVQPSESKSTTPVLPVISLVNTTVEVEGRVQARVRATKCGQVEFDSRETLVVGTALFRRKAGEGDSGSVGEKEMGTMSEHDQVAFGAENDWTRTVVFPSISEKLGSSFTTLCIRRMYMFKISCVVLMEGIERHEEFEQPVEVTLHPPLAGAGPDGQKSPALLADEMAAPPKYEQ